jgi:hypothetical protein
MTGTWEEKEGTYYATMNLEGIEYKGVFFKQYDESSSHKQVMTFSLIGDDNTSIWGSKITDEVSLVTASVQELFAGKISGNVTLPDFGSNMKVTMTSNSQYLRLNSAGTKLIYSAPENDTTATVNVSMVVNGKTTNTTVNAYLKGYKETKNEDNLVAYYSFDEVSKDSSGNGNDLTVKNVARGTDDARGKVAYFNGINAYLQAPSAVTSSDDITLMAWVNSTNRNSWERIFDFGDGQGNSIFLTTHSYTPEAVRASYPGTAGEIQADSYSMMPANKWEHVAMTVDSSAKTVNLYINGTLVSTKSISAAKNLTALFTGTQNYIGKSQYDDPYFKGYMDDVAIFDTALNADKIADYMNNGIIKEAKATQNNASVIIAQPGEKLTFDAETITSVNGSVANILNGNVVKSVSEGNTTLKLTLAGGSTREVTIQVEEDQDVTYGDVNESGKIDVVDMEAVQKQILGIETLNASALKAASVKTFDGKISVLDMEIIQKHILGIGLIEQIR